jgi:hypothetical protein
MANGYTKLAGGMATGRLATNTVSLWLGTDHLLLAERDGYSENYKRFYFADIEAFTLRETKRRAVYEIVLICLLVFFIWMAVITGIVGVWIFGSIGALVLVFLILNRTKGPTCVTHVATAVQREEIPSLRRSRQAEKTLREISEAIAAAQGGILSAEEVRQRFEAAAIQAATPSQLPIPPLATPPPPLQP